MPDDAIPGGGKGIFLRVGHDLGVKPVHFIPVLAVPDRGKDHSAPPAHRGGTGAQRNGGREASREVFHGNPAGARSRLYPGAVRLDLQVGRAAGMGLECPSRSGLAMKAVGGWRNVECSSCGMFSVPYFTGFVFSLFSTTLPLFSFHYFRIFPLFHHASAYLILFSYFLSFSL